MSKKKWVLVILGTLVVAAGALAYVLTPPSHPEQTGESPELGRPGAFKIGTVVINYPLGTRKRIAGLGALAGSTEPEERTLPVRVWYPAVAGGLGAAVVYSHEMKSPGKADVVVRSQGVAVADAKPFEGGRFPLVLMSHGYGGWSTQFSRLAEHIATRGYIVASIEHQDQPVSGVVSALVSFGNVMAGRSLDQRQVLARLLAEAESGKTPFSKLIDTKNVALIGYSMGGFGALATAGASYSYDTNPMSKLPAASQQLLQDAEKESVPLKALITFAPWGAQPGTRAWSATALQKITAPVLLVSGNQDDVVNFKEGVTWLYKNLSKSERHLLVYREARHNIVGDEFIVDPDARFSAYEFLKEPVWRSERLNDINQHFVTAFLDLHLKGDLEKRAYLDVPVVDSNAGEWPTAFAEQLNGTRAGAEQPKYWRGFQKRWATGLEMQHATVGQALE